MFRLLIVYDTQLTIINRREKGATAARRPRSPPYTLPYERENVKKDTAEEPLAIEPTFVPTDLDVPVVGNPEVFLCDSPTCPIASARCLPVSDEQVTSDASVFPDDAPRQHAYELGELLPEDGVEPSLDAHGASTCSALNEEEEPFVQGLFRADAFGSITPADNGPTVVEAHSEDKELKPETVTGQLLPTEAPSSATVLAEHASSNLARTAEPAAQTTIPAKEVSTGAPQSTRLQDELEVARSSSTATSELASAPTRGGVADGLTDVSDGSQVDQPDVQGRAYAFLPPCNKYVPRFDKKNDAQRLSTKKAAKEALVKEEQSEANKPTTQKNAKELSARLTQPLRRISSRPNALRLTMITLRTFGRTRPASPFPAPVRQIPSRPPVWRYPCLGPHPLPTLMTPSFTVWNARLRPAHLASRLRQ